GGLITADGDLPEDLYGFIAQDMFRSLSNETRRGLLLLALGAIATSDVAQTALGAPFDRVVTEATECGFVGNLPRTELSIHPLFRRFLVEQVRESARADVKPLLDTVSDALIRHREWNECLVMAREFPWPEIVLRTFDAALDDLLSAARTGT